MSDTDKELEKRLIMAAESLIVKQLATETRLDT